MASGIPIKLSKSNSSRKFLEKDRIGLKNRSAPDPVPVDIEEATTPRGKPNMVASAIVLEHITRHTGSPTSRAHAAAATSGKLYSMTTAPASKLLKAFTWKEYFTSGAFYKNGVLAEFENISTGAEEEEGCDKHAASGKTEFETKQDEFRDNLNPMFDDMVLRAEKLWNQLKFSKFEQKFFKMTLCKGPPKSLSHCQELAAYISLLQVHLMATMKVLESIRIREIAVAKCYDIIAALHRRRIPRSHHQSSDSVISTSLSSPGHGENSGSSRLWKEELLHALDYIRCTSLEVIKCIQLWRRNLWRPLPFVWNGDNYLSKMRFDMNILETPSNIEIISTMGLNPNDLLCVVFFDPQVKRSRQQQGIDHKAATSSIDAHEGNKEVSMEVRALPPPEDSEDMKRLTSDFLGNIDEHELYTAASIVMEDEKLQNALIVEQSSLLEKGVFIPSLRQKINAHPHSLPIV